jgi:deoxyribodipyrimidine photo-lyase
LLLPPLSFIDGGAVVERAGLSNPVIVWFRQDLRLADQTALLAAAAAGPVVPVYVLDDESPAPRHRMGAASRWWLHHSLKSLADDLEAIGSRLVLRQGRADQVLAQLAEETQADAIHALRHSEPWWRDVEHRLGARLKLFDGDALAPLRGILNGSGQPYRVYSAFWRTLNEQMPPPEPSPAPQHLAAPDRWPASDTLASFNLLPTRPNWAAGFDAVAGEAEALRKLADFADEVSHYEDRRNLPSDDGTSGLSPHLHFGEISPATVWHGVNGRLHAEKFRKELAWRDFAKGVVQAIPTYADANGVAKFDALPWRHGDAADADFAGWRQGRTGYPIVDAGMRQLWHTGLMHNRVRMITASFLVKHLLIDWRRGWDWYWDTLIDADFGNNSVNWQWVAGTGIDANMFSRIMAPLVQSERFDAGDYIRTWVPELADITGDAIHDPGPRNGYPDKIVGHKEGRERALAALAASR